MSDVLLLGNEEVHELLDMRTALEALREAYREVAAGSLSVGTRTDLHAPTSHPHAVYSLKAVSAASPFLGLATLRVNSDVLSWSGGGSQGRREKLPLHPDGRWVGFVVLFATDTGAPLGIFPDGVLQRIRVGATSGLAADYLARPQLSEATILGTGWQAGAQAMALCAVRRVERVRVYSPDRARRESFCREWSPQLGVELVPTASAADAVVGAELVLCATNAMRPVFDADWLSPGTHVGAIRPTELDPRVFDRADRVVFHTKGERAARAVLPEANLPAARLDKGWDGVPEAEMFATLPELVAGHAEPRRGSEEITCFLNNKGLGIQFTVVSWLVLQAARRLGAGREIPASWFTQDVHS